MDNNEQDSNQSKLFQEYEVKPAHRTIRLKEDKSEECAFCQIVRNQEKERPARQILFRDDSSIAFLDRRPVFLGHTLLVPIIHYETIFDLPKDLVAPLFSNAQMLAKAVKTALSADGIFIGMNNKVSQSVPHLHIHIVPRKTGDGLKGFFWPRRSYQSEAQMNDISNSIRRAIQDQRSLG